MKPLIFLVLTVYAGLSSLIIIEPAWANDKSADAPNIASAVSKLKSVYDKDISQMLIPPEEFEKTKFKSPEELLNDHKLITKSLLKHLQNIGGIDFDILLSAQDWDKGWTVTF